MRFRGFHPRHQNWTDLCLCCDGGGCRGFLQYGLGRGRRHWSQPALLQWPVALVAGRLHSNRPRWKWFHQQDGISSLHVVAPGSGHGGSAEPFGSALWMYGSGQDWQVDIWGDQQWLAGPWFEVISNWTSTKACRWPGLIAMAERWPLRWAHRCQKFSLGTGYQWFPKVDQSYSLGGIDFKGPCNLFEVSFYSFGCQTHQLCMNKTNRSTFGDIEETEAEQKGASKLKPFLGFPPIIASGQENVKGGKRRETSGCIYVVPIIFGLYLARMISFQELALKNFDLGFHFNNQYQIKRQLSTWWFPSCQGKPRKTEETLGEAWAWAVGWVQLYLPFLDWLYQDERQVRNCECWKRNPCSLLNLAAFEALISSFATCRSHAFDKPGLPTQPRFPL